MTYNMPIAKTSSSSLISSFMRNGEELESILNKSPVVLYLARIEESYTIELITDNVRQFGYTPDDFYSGRVSFSKIVFPDDFERTQSEVKAFCVEPNRNEFTQEYRIFTADGQVRWVDDRTYIRRNEKGEITHFQGTIVDITSRKQAEEKLNNQTVFLNTILDNIPTPIFYKDEKAVYRGCNRAFAEKIIGLPKEQIIGRTVFDFSDAIPYENAKVYHEHDMNLINHPGNETYESKVKCTDNKYHDFFFSKSTFLNPSGAVAGIVGVMLDISGHKKSEERLERLNKCLISFGPDPDNNINSLVAACGELMEASCALYNRLENGMLNLLGKWNVPDDFKDVSNPDGHLCYDVIREDGDLPFIVRNLQQSSYAESDPNVKAYKLQTYIGKAVRRGAESIGSLCVVYQKDIEFSKEDKEIFSVIASAISVEEERKYSVKESEDTKKRQEAILNSIPDIAWLKDRESRFLAVNEAFNKTCGFSTDYVVGKSDLEIWPKDLALKYREDDCDVMKTGKQKIVEEQLAEKDGTRSWIETVKTPVFGSKGEVIGTTGIARDVTERKKVEQSLQAHNHEIQEAKEIAEKSAMELARVVKELTNTKQDLERFNNAAVGREMRIIEVKREVNTLLAELGKEPKYKMVL